MGLDRRTGSTRSASPLSGAYHPFRTTFLLAAVYAVSFLDRQLPSVLAESIRADLNISDTQIGVLTGLAFAIFYTTFGIPIGWLADRVHRVRLIAVALLIWSAFTGACGMAANFWQLAAARMGVGAGEAGCNPASLSLISDLFPPGKRGLPMAIFMLGSPVGSMTGVMGGAWIAAEFGWRTAFGAAAALGLVVGAVFFTLVREPPRGLSDGALEPRPKLDEGPLKGIAETLRICAASPLIVCTALATAVAALGGVGMLFWAPAMLIRSKGMTLTELALYFGPMAGLTAIAGLLVSGFALNRLERYPRTYALMPAGAFLLAAPMIVAGAFAPSWPIALACLSVPFFMSCVKDAATGALLLTIVPPERRATVTAFLVWTNSVLGFALGPVFVGWISDALKPTYGAQSLTYGFAALAPLYLAASAAFYISSRLIGRRLGAAPAPA